MEKKELKGAIAEGVVEGLIVYNLLLAIAKWILSYLN